MTTRRDEYGRPIGRALPGWTAPPPVTPVTLTGRTCRIEPVTHKHFPQLHEALDKHSSPGLWSYYPQGPFSDTAQLAQWITGLNAMPHAIITNDHNTACGIAAYMRNDIRNGTVEIGNIVFGAALARTTAATEAIFLMLCHAFDELGYRRVEWKCDSLNEPSRNAAQRFGFSFEGIFRNPVVYRERNRDTAWYSIIDSEWPKLRREFQRWLDRGNFAADGTQLSPLRMPKSA